MSIQSVSSDHYTNYVNNNASAKNNVNKEENTVAKEKEVVANDKVNKNSAAVYEPSNKQINKMSKEERAALVQQLKQDAAQRQQQFQQTIMKMIGQQGDAYGKATDIWKFLASGNYKVDEATKLQAQKDIAEDGYWGVKQTSERIFSFAQALAGDDKEMMKQMQKAFEKGFEQATGAWGKELPDICKQTKEAVNKKFEDYFNEGNEEK